jgi:hypothetical protein
VLAFLPCADFFFEQKPLLYFSVSLSGSKSSASGDWLGLGDDVTDDHLNASLTAAKSPESDQGTMPPAKIAETKQDGELSKMLDLVPDGSKKKTESDDKYVFITFTQA